MPDRLFFNVVIKMCLSLQRDLRTTGRKFLPSDVNSGRTEKVSDRDNVTRPFVGPTLIKVGVRRCTSSLFQLSLSAMQAQVNVLNAVLISTTRWPQHTDKCV